MLSVLPVPSVLLGLAIVSGELVLPVLAIWSELPPALPSEARLGGLTVIVVGGGGGGEMAGGGKDVDGGERESMVACTNLP